MISKYKSRSLTAEDKKKTIFIDELKITVLQKQHILLLETKAIETV